MVSIKGLLLCMALIIGGAVSENSVKAVCKPDNTVDVSIVYDKNATILALTYGSCTEASPRVRGHTGWSDNGWNVSLDVEACEMGDKMRTIQYEQNATFTIGVDDGMKMVFAVFTVKSFCEYTKSYTVKYSYGDLTVEEESFGKSGGTLEVAFVIKSMNSSFSGEKTASTVAGDSIYLALEVNSTAFPDYDHADNFTATVGKLFAPKSCSVFAGDSIVNKTYTLFGPDKCDNDFISLVVSYDDTTNSWHISHILFLLDDRKSSSYELECTVIVCDASDSADCVKVHDCHTVKEDVCEPSANWKYMESVVNGGDGISRDCKEMADYIVSMYSSQNSANVGEKFTADYYKSICDYYWFDNENYTDKSEAAAGPWKEHCCPQNYPATKFCIDGGDDWLNKAARG